MWSSLSINPFQLAKGEVAKGLQTLIFFTRSAASRHFVGGRPDRCIVDFQEEVEKADENGQTPWGILKPQPCTVN